MLTSRMISADAMERAYSQAKRETKKVYALVFLQRKVSLPLSYFVLVPLGVSPNAITAVSSVVGVLAAVAFAMGRFGLGAWLTIIWGIMDCCDGEVARLTGRQSKFGEVLETLNSNLQYAIWLPAIAYGLYARAELALKWVFAAFLACAIFNVVRGLYGKYPEAYLGAPEGELKSFLACQFKDMFEARRKNRPAAFVFYAWRNVIAQHGLFELVFLICALLFPAALPHATMFYVVVYAVFGIVTFVAVNAAGFVAGR
jgi:phosphatidylglycerophosphate synthase